MSAPRRYRLRPNTVGLTLVGWAVVVLALATGVTGLVLALTGHDSSGAVLMGATGIVLGLCVMAGRVNEMPSGSCHSQPETDDRKPR